MKMEKNQNKVQKEDLHPSNEPNTPNNEKRPGPRIPVPKPPKFNYYWLYGLIAIVLLGLQFFSFQNTLQETNWQQFEQGMLKSGDVEKVIVVNKEIVEVYLTSAALSKEEYKDVAVTS